MKEIVPTPIDAEAATRFLVGVFIHGGAGSDAAAACAGSAWGPAYALAPACASPSRLLDFAHGGVLARSHALPGRHPRTEPVPNTIGFAASILSARLMQGEHALWVHEPLLTSEEAAARDLPYTMLGESMYLVYAQPFDQKRVAERIRFSLQSWHFLAFVTGTGDNVRSVDQLIRAANFVLAGAYDGESFVYAERGARG